MNLSLLTPPEVEPISLQEAKAFLKFEEDDEDALILSLITAARQELEATTNRAFITQTWRYKLNRFDQPYIRIPVAPVQSIAAFSYLDANGVVVNLGAGSPFVLDSDYVLDSTSEPARLRPAYGVSWPSSRLDYDAITIDIEAGYGDEPTDVPEPIRTAIKYRVNDMFENRETTITGTIVAQTPVVERLVWPYKVVAFP